MVCIDVLHQEHQNLVQNLLFFCFDCKILQLCKNCFHCKVVCCLLPSTDAAKWLMRSPGHNSCSCILEYGWRAAPCTSAIQRHGGDKKCSGVVRHHRNGLKSNRLIFVGLWVKWLFKKLMMDVSLRRQQEKVYGRDISVSHHTFNHVTHFRGLGTTLRSVV